MKIRNIKTTLFISSFLMSFSLASLQAWSWDSAENVLPSLREELDREIQAYRQQVNNGLSLHERVLILDRLINNYKTMGVNVIELETERSRLLLEEKQQQLRASASQDEAKTLYDRGVTEYKKGQFLISLGTFQEAERLLPQDSAIKELRRKLSNISAILEEEVQEGMEAELTRLAITRYLESDPKRSLNALIYASDKKVDRTELVRFRRLLESDHPELEQPHIPTGTSLVDFKLRLTLEAIYDGRYLSAIDECTDVLDLEPKNVLALTRLGSAYFAMNEKDKARQIWTKALQLDANNEVLKKFLYGSKGAARVEVNR
jgi:tetratricopeptide (TPR) repeat protein